MASRGSAASRIVSRIVHPARLILCAAIVLLVSGVGAFVLRADAGAARAPISGSGSSFASPAINTWIAAVSNAPYNLSVLYSSSNSGEGRYEFTNQATDFAVSDIGYFGNTDTTPPSFPFDYVPVVGEGVPFPTTSLA
jgi:ABC-type phosphate transport system substrate-binding protein